jgi:hypothetical protein
MSTDELTTQERITRAVLGNNYRQTIRIDSEGKKRERNTAKDFELSKPQKQVLELLPKTGWARRYVNLIQSAGSVSEWRPYYEGEFIDDPYLQGIISDIRPINMDQIRMRRKALRLQITLGLFALTWEPTVGRIAYDVWHPDAIKRGKDNDTVRLHTGKDKPAEHDIAYLRRFCDPDDYERNTPRSDLLDVVELMDLYCCALDAMQSKAEQGKIFNRLLHLKLDNTAKNEFWATPGNTDPKTGKLLIEQSLEDLETATRMAYQGKAESRFAPHPFIWPGDVNDINLGDPVTPQIVEAVNEIGAMGAAAMDIPTAMLTGDEGTANHWNEAYNQRSFRTQTLGPALALHDSFFSSYAFQPRLRARRGSQLEYNGMRVDRIEMRSDTAILDNKPDNSAEMLQGYMDGFLFDREQVADAYGEPLAPLPEGVSEYDHWRTLKGFTEQAEGDALVEAPVEGQSIAAAAIDLLT